ncbi:MAG: DUF3224 domain-containing protein [Ilumatobacteraceae bacterium]
MGTINTAFEVTGWDEHQFDRHAGTAKLTRAKVTKSYNGDLDGTSVTLWVMAYAADGNATFVGIERIDATIGDRDGTIVLQHVGRFANGTATAELDIISGSCTGDFAELAGTGRLTADPAGRVTLDTTL